MKQFIHGIMVLIMTCFAAGCFDDLNNMYNDIDRKLTWTDFASASVAPVGFVAKYLQTSLISSSVVLIGSDIIYSLIFGIDKYTKTLLI